MSEQGHLCSRVQSMTLGPFYGIVDKGRDCLITYTARKRRKLQRRHRFSLLSCAIILLVLISTGFLSTLRLLSSISTQQLDILDEYNAYKSAFSLDPRSWRLNVHQHAVHHIYVDVGCSNGETIEHFIHFHPNSSLYDIITFEPDPYNYQLCKQVLAKEKYKDFNIIIIPRVAWVRNEKVFFTTNRGQQSRITANTLGRSPFPPSTYKTVHCPTHFRR